MGSSDGAKKIKKKKKYMLREKERNVARNYKFCCHEMKIKVLQQSVLATTFPRMDEFYGRCTALWHLQWKNSSPWIWRDFALARKQILANVSQACVDSFQIGSFQRQRFGKWVLARVPDAGRKHWN